MNPEQLKGKICDRDGKYPSHYAEGAILYADFYKPEDIKSAISGLIKFHEDRIEELIKEVETLVVGWTFYKDSIDEQYESIMAIEHWLEDVI